jgi:hypothetical protein
MVACFRRTCGGAVSRDELCMNLKIGRPRVIESVRLELAAPAELRMDGTLNSPTAQTELGRLLVELHAYVVGAKLASFTVDLRGLSFVNSSALRLFVDWISRAESSAYRLIFVTDRAITWHRLSFSVLKSLAPRHVEII